MRDPSDFGRVGVLMGGCSSEREISLKSGQGIFKALSGAGFPVVAIDVSREDQDVIKNQLKASGIDVAFIALHGRLGEDGGIQGMLEDLEIPYIGSGVHASQKAFNKTITQQVLKSQGLPVPPHVIITDGQRRDFKEVFGHLKKLPFMVKAACEGSSIGIATVRHPSQWESAIQDALELGPFVVIEKYIKGREVTAGILDQEPLPLVEICPKSGVFDFASKYQKGLTDYVVPAAMPAELTERIQKYALAAHQALGCEGFSRVDIRIDEEHRPYILEVNTIPGFTETSLFPKAAQCAGYSFLAVCEKLLELAHGKKVQS